MGFIFGATHIMRYGGGPNGVMRTLGQYMLGSGAAFGFFMSIGSIIRTDAHPQFAEVFARQQVGRARIISARFPQQRREG